MWKIIKAWLIAAWTSILNHVTDFLKMVFEHGHILVDKIIKLIEQALESPLRVIWIALAVLIVFDIALLGKIGVIDYGLKFFVLLFDIITKHFEAGILFCATTVVIVALIKRVDK